MWMLQTRHDYWHSISGNNKKCYISILFDFGCVNKKQRIIWSGTSCIVGFWRADCGRLDIKMITPTDWVMWCILWQGVLSSQSLSIGASSSASAAGQQLAGLLRPVNTAAATNRPAHIASMPSTLPSVQFISKPVQILQSSASCAPQLLSTLPATNQVNMDVSIAWCVCMCERNLLYHFIVTDLCGVLEKSLLSIYRNLMWPE